MKIKTRILAAPGLHYLASRFGWPSLRRSAFDAKFDSGSWDHYKEPKQFVSLVEELNQRGRLLAIGCGTNPLGRAMSRASYSSFVGVDISPAAIKLAENHSPYAQTFYVSDMLDFRTEATFETIVFSESLYFIPDHAKNIVPLLNYWRHRLAPNGNIVVTTVDPDRYSLMVQLIEDHFHVSKHFILAGTNRLVLVFN